MNPMDGFACVRMGRGVENEHPLVKHLILLVFVEPRRVVTLVSPYANELGQFKITSNFDHRFRY